MEKEEIFKNIILDVIQLNGVVTVKKNCYEMRRTVNGKTTVNYSRTFEDMFYDCFREEIHQRFICGDFKEYQDFLAKIFAPVTDEEIETLNAHRNEGEIPYCENLDYLITKYEDVIARNFNWENDFVAERLSNAMWNLQGLTILNDWQGEPLETYEKLIGIILKGLGLKSVSYDMIVRM